MGCSSLFILGLSNLGVLGLWRRSLWGRHPSSLALGGGGGRRRGLRLHCVQGDHVSSLTRTRAKSSRAYKHSRRPTIDRHSLTFRIQERRIWRSEREKSLRRRGELWGLWLCGSGRDTCNARGVVIARRGGDGWGRSSEAAGVLCWRRKRTRTPRQ